MAVIDDLRAAITGWRRTRDIRFGRIAEWALQRALPMPRSALTTTQWDAVFHAHDPLDVPRLIQFVSEHSFDPGNGERIRLLGRRSDPNIVAGAIGLLESFPDAFPNPEGISPEALLPLLGLVHASKDPRAVDVLLLARERLETTWQYTIGHGMIGPVDDFTSSVTPFAARVDLGDVSTALEAGYPEQLAQTRDEDRLRFRLRTTDQGLLAAIHAAPDDDHPRMVFADALIERGDPRGEFINLQLARARGPVSDEAMHRERELASSAAVFSWGLPLSRAGRVRFERGLPIALSFSRKMSMQIINDPAFRLLREVAIHWVIAMDELRAILNGNALEHLGHLNYLRPDMLALLKRDRPWISLAIEGSVDAQALRHLPHLTNLWLFANREPVSENPIAGLSHLTQFQLVLPEAMTEVGWPVESASVETLTLTGMSARGIERLGSLPRLHTLSLTASVEHISLTSLARRKLTSLTLHDGEVQTIIDALPTLRELRFETRNALPAVLALERSSQTQLRLMRFGDVELVEPFTERGVVRICSTARPPEPLIAFLSALTEACASRIEIVPRANKTLTLDDELGMPEMEALVRKHARIPVVKRWQ